MEHVRCLYVLVLAVSPFEYGIFAFFNYLTPLIAIVFAYTGWTILYKKPEQKEATAIGNERSYDTVTEAKYEKIITTNSLFQRLT